MATINDDTVDGRNPAPPRMYKTLKLVQEFFHQQYHYLLHKFGTPGIRHGKLGHLRQETVGL